MPKSIKPPRELVFDIASRFTGNDAVAIANGLTQPFRDTREHTLIATDGRAAFVYEAGQDEWLGWPDAEPTIAKQPYVSAQLGKYLKSMTASIAASPDDFFMWEAMSASALAKARRLYNGRRIRYEDYALVRIGGHCFRAEYILKAVAAMRLTLPWCGVPSFGYCADVGFLRMWNAVTNVVVMQVLVNGNRDQPFVAEGNFHGFVIMDAETGETLFEDDVSYISELREDD